MPATSQRLEGVNDGEEGEDGPIYFTYMSASKSRTTYLPFFSLSYTSFEREQGEGRDKKETKKNIPQKEPKSNSSLSALTPPVTPAIGSAKLSSHGDRAREPEDGRQDVQDQSG